VAVSPSLLRRRGGALVIFALFFIVWEFGVHLFGVKEYLLPPPSKVWMAFVARHDAVIAAAWVTTKEILAGYVFAVLVSVPLALAVAYSRFMEQAVYPVIVFFQIVPKIAIAPLFIIWFGFGFLPKLLLVFLLSFFPIVVASIAGFKSADRDVMDFARTTGAGGWRLFVTIRLPQALPHIFTGLKVGAALAATAAVVAEFVASDRGLGYLLLQYNGQLDTPMVFATIVLLSLIGLAVYYAVEVIERLAIPWHVSQQQAPHDATM
jgi:NitT/TauT family transport system permease protein